MRAIPFPTDAMSAWYRKIRRCFGRELLQWSGLFGAAPECSPEQIAPTSLPNARTSSRPVGNPIGTERADTCCWVLQRQGWEYEPSTAEGRGAWFSHSASPLATCISQAKLHLSFFNLLPESNSNCTSHGVRPPGQVNINPLQCRGNSEQNIKIVHYC